MILNKKKNINLNISNSYFTSITIKLSKGFAYKQGILNNKYMKQILHK